MKTTKVVWMGLIIMALVTACSSGGGGKGSSDFDPDEECQTFADRAMYIEDCEAFFTEGLESGDPAVMDSYYNCTTGVTGADESLCTFLVNTAFEMHYANSYATCKSLLKQGDQTMVIACAPFFTEALDDKFEALLADEETCQSLEPEALTEDLYCTTLLSVEG